MKFYRKQPLEAEQFDSSQKLIFGYSIIPSGLVDAITGKPVYYSALVDDICQDSDDDTGIVLDVGDWVVKEADEIEVIADDVFKQTYAELPVIPKVFGDTIEELKANHYELSEFFNEWKCNYEEQEMIARAWLDGYVVEEDE
jgi:hypothetical protein